MSFRKPCHMPFRKLIPPLTLTDLFVITCNNINEDDDDDDEDGNDNKMSLFTLDIVLAHRLLRSSFLFTGCPL